MGVIRGLRMNYLSSPDYARGSAQALLVASRSATRRSSGWRLVIASVAAISLLIGLAVFWLWLSQRRMDERNYYPNFHSHFQDANAEFGTWPPSLQWFSKLIASKRNYPGYTYLLETHRHAEPELTAKRSDSTSFRGCVAVSLAFWQVL